MTSDDRIEIEAVKRQLAVLGVRFSKVLHHANGAPRAYMAKLRGAIYEDDGTKVVDLITDFDTLVRQHRYASVLPDDGRGGIITCAWVVPDDAPVPPPFIAAGMVEEIIAGNALVILADSIAARDQAELAISALLTGKTAEREPVR